MKNIEDKVILTTSDVARTLRVAVSTVQRWVEIGVIDSWKTEGGHRRIHKNSLNKFIEHESGARMHQHENIGRDAVLDVAVKKTNTYGEFAIQNEVLRTSAVLNTKLLDTPPNHAFDRLARMAKEVTNTPIATIGLIDNDRLWFKASIGIKEEQIPKIESICWSTVQSNSLLIVENILCDERFSDYPLIKVENGIRFYAGQALLDANGFRVGTLCVADFKPRGFSAKDAWLLSSLAALVSEEIQRHQWKN